MTEDKKPDNMEVTDVVEAQPTFIASVERLAANPDVDPAKLQKFMEMQEHILDRNAKQAFNAAMVRTQSEMPIVPEDEKNKQTNSTYASYKNVLKYTKPVYTAEGFSLLFYEEDAKREGEIRVCADIMHSEGHTEKRYVDIPLDDKGIKGSVNKTKTHAKGSSLSYGKGYLIRMIFNIPTGDDDDGNAAGKENPKFTTKEQKGEIKSLFKTLKLSDKEIEKRLADRFEGITDLDEVYTDAADILIRALRKMVELEKEKADADN